MILGIELKGHGYKIAWNIREYIETLEDKAMEALEQQAQNDLAARKETTRA